MASLLNGSLAASLAPLPELRLHAPALTYSWHLHGFPLEWEPCCFPCSSSRVETTCPSPVDICMASLFNGSLPASLVPLPEVRLYAPVLTYSWHFHGFPLEWESCCFPSSSSRGETTCPSPNLQLTFAWLPSLMEALMLPLLLFQRWDYLSQHNLQLTFAWLPSWMGALLLPWLLYQRWDYMFQP